MSRQSLPFVNLVMVRLLLGTNFAGLESKSQLWKMVYMGAYPFTSYITSGWFIIQKIIVSGTLSLFHHNASLWTKVSDARVSLVFTLHQALIRGTEKSNTFWLRLIMGRLSSASKVHRLIVKATCIGRTLSCLRSTRWFSRLFRVWPCGNAWTHCLSRVTKFIPPHSPPSQLNRPYSHCLHRKHLLRVSQ